jgi:hypothetical protein
MLSGMSVRVLFAAKHHFSMNAIAISILIRNLVAARAGFFCFSVTTVPIFCQPTAGGFIGFFRPVWHYRLFLKVLQAATGA